MTKLVLNTLQPFDLEPAVITDVSEINGYGRRFQVLARGSESPISFTETRKSLLVKDLNIWIQFPGSIFQDLSNETSREKLKALKTWVKDFIDFALNFMRMSACCLKTTLIIIESSIAID